MLQRLETWIRVELYSIVNKCLKLWNLKSDCLPVRELQLQSTHLFPILCSREEDDNSHECWNVTRWMLECWKWQLLLNVHGCYYLNLLCASLLNAGRECLGECHLYQVLFKKIYLMPFYVSCECFVACRCHRSGMSSVNVAPTPHHYCDKQRWHYHYASHPVCHVTPNRSGPMIAHNMPILQTKLNADLSQDTTWRIKRSRSGQKGQRRDKKRHKAQWDETFIDKNCLVLVWCLSCVIEFLHIQRKPPKDNPAQ